MKRLLKNTGKILAGIVIIICILGLIPDGYDTIPEGVKGKYIEINGNKIRYYQTGTGPDVLFIHGLPGMVEIFEPLEKHLSGTNRLTFFDRPGHAYSGTDNYDYTIENNAQTAKALIEKLKLKDVTVVGHSYGCSVAMAMAVENPENVKSIVMLGTYCMYYPDKKTAGINRIFSIPVFGKGFAFITGKTIVPKGIKKALEKSFSPNEALMTDEVLKMSQEYWSTSKGLVTIGKESVKSSDSRIRLSKKYDSIKKRIVFVHGEQDQGARKRHSLDAHKLVKDSELILYDKVGHFPHFVHPEKVAGIIKKESRREGE
ncbi:MAG: alpha/beta hydrolase [bacterium]|nr:alpha/beta hydrolase [bacterium]